MAKNDVGTFATVGDSGLRYDDTGRLVIGQAPRIAMHADREQELENGETVPVGPLRPILDLQPTVIGFADLLTILIDQNETGRGTDFLGHVRVIATAKDERIMITDEGKVVVAEADSE